VLLGKVKLTEGAYSRHHPAFSPPVNPWNSDCWTGVSSSGSGVSVAAGLCFANIGTDTGGSIRFPSAANGVVGIKPTWGRVSRAGVFPLADTLDHIGPMARTVSDAAAMLQIMAGRDDRDPTSSSKVVPDYLGSEPIDLHGLRVGVDSTYISDSVDPEQAEATRMALDLLEQAGCEVVKTRIPYDSTCQAWPVTTAVEAAYAHRETYPARQAEYGPIAELLEAGNAIDAAQYFEAELVRRAFKAALNTIFSQVDLIVCPSMPFSGLPKEGSLEMDEAENDLSQIMKFTAPYDYSGNPTISLPWRCGAQGVPTSIQIIAGDFEEALLIQVALRLERLMGFNQHPAL
ncbi:MAG: amidase, partial [Halieaceae bacterium]|nr:amidase [Halieaceae bacterium]